MFSWRLLLIPFSVLYGMIVRVRNFLYDWKIKTSMEISGASICIGNITVGGTGKSPLTIYITQFLIDYEPVILSRGYGRKTRGLIAADSTSTASSIGDEPLMYWNRFDQKVPVIVAEKRRLGIEFIREKSPETVILLDDAFQHRAVKAGLNIVLMTYERPIFKDFPFPAGNLRENRSGIRRADVVVVTKCPEFVSDTMKQQFATKLSVDLKNIFFSTIHYGKKKGLLGSIWKSFPHILLVTGIAQPAPLKRFLSEEAEITSIEFPDHHVFTREDVQKIVRKVATFANDQCAIVTTEKDAVRLLDWKEELIAAKVPLFVQTMDVKIDRETEFKDLLLKYVVRANERSR